MNVSEMSSKIPIPECPVCLEEMTSSHKVLTCQHTFCISCLETLHDEKDGYIRCPECRALTFTKYIASLPNNIMLIRIFESLAATKRKKEESDTSDDEIITSRRKITKSRKKFRKIRKPESSDEEPIINDSDESDSKQTVAKRNPIADSSDENDEKNCDGDTSDQSKQSEIIKVDSKVKLHSDHENRVTTKPEEAVNYHSDSSTNVGSSGSETEIYVSEIEEQNQCPAEASDSEHDVPICRSKPQRNVCESSSDDDHHHHQQQPNVTPDCKTSVEKGDGRSSERIRSRHSRVFHMPSRRDVLDGIVASTSSPQKQCSMAMSHKPRRLKNDFTKERSSYNYDPVYTSDESDEDFIDDEGEDRESVSSSASGGGRRAKKWDSSDDESPIGKKAKQSKTGRGRICKPEYSDESDRGQWTDDEKFPKKELISERAKSLLSKREKNVSKFNQLKEQRLKKMKK